ncbi:hypothetical protein [Humisphaera borealis]|uniref:General secretion pathway protein GspM n=1 Tax=Humisphaera borealis TaxID=2807512 RepID=A0A7M2X0M2_9BACT|nr:hypothetical protein [Humisphaera borealis]QOV90972.1 hypothetical protein IPV69_06320 [Humisphaera borealis]
MTRLLAILCLIAAVAAGFALVRLDAAATQAAAAERELVDSRQFLADPARRLAAGQVGLIGGPATGPSGLAGAGAGANGALESGIRQSVAAAGIADRLREIVWTKPGNSGADEAREVTGYLQFGNVNLEQLTRFLHHLAETDPTSRTQMIELAAPASEGSPATNSATPSAAGEPSSETWSAVVTVSYRLRPSGKRPAN